MSIKVAVAQLALSTADVKANLAKAEEYIRKAASQGAQLIVLPELTNSGYAFTSVEEARRNCCEVDGPEIARWVSLSQELQIIVVAGVGICEGDHLFNCSIIIDEIGVRGIYKKAHLFGDEPDFFIAGDMPPLVVNTAIGRVGTMICYDIEFPEWVRIAMLDGAQLLALPTNWPDIGIPVVTTPLEVVRVQAAASQNKIVIAACDRTHDENGVSWISASAIVDFDGNIKKMVTDKSEQLLVAEVELAIDDSIGSRNSVRGDRRVDLYQKWLYSEGK